MDRYQNAQEFIDDCSMGLDIEFTYHGIGYGVLGWYKQGPLAYRKDSFGYKEKIFDNAHALLDGFKTGGIPLKNIITQIELE